MTRIDAFLKLTEWNVQVKNVSLPVDTEGLSVPMVLDFAFQITDAELEKAKELWIEDHAGDWLAPGFFSIGYLNLASIEFVEYAFQFFAASEKKVVSPRWMTTDYTDEKPEYYFDAV